MRAPLRTGWLWMLCLSLALVSSCHRGRPPQPIAPAPLGSADSEGAASAKAVSANAPQGIAWFNGSVPEAFAFAKHEGRPVLLFWGAAWCPYCHTLKATVFVRPDFIAKTRLFVPVYLDGDNPGAQSWGEQFGVLGYPTLVVLDADRHEIIRLGAGRDVGEYAAVLDTALEDVQPIDTLLPLAAAGKSLSPDQCRRLAYNDWTLDTIAPERLGEQAGALQAAASACSSGPEHADLVIYAAALAAHANSAAGAQQRSAARLAALTDQVATILEDRELALGSAPALASLDESFFQAVRAQGAQRAMALGDGYVRAMEAAANAPRFVVADQLGFIRGKLRALKSLAEPHQSLPAEAVAAADQRIDAALAAERSQYVLPGLVNATLNILEETDQYSKAYAIVKAEIDRADAPYYFQADLAEIAERLGHREEAIHLLDVAYHGSRGPATRFQWGILYLGGLLRMAPNDAERIERTGLEVLAELDGPDRIAARARVRLETLDQQLRDWNGAAHGTHADVLQALRARAQQICLRIPAQQPARTRCDAFLIG